MIFGDRKTGKLEDVKTRETLFSLSLSLFLVKKASPDSNFSLLSFFLSSFLEAKERERSNRRRSW